MLKCLKTRIALNYPIPLLLLTLSLAVSGTAYSSEQEWILEREEDRIKVYTRPESDSPFLAVKVTAVINAPFEKVVEAMGSGDGCGEWRAVGKSS